MPAYRATALTTALAVEAERPWCRDGMRPAPRSARDPGAVTVSVGSGTGQLETLGHCWETTVSAVFSSVPAATRLGSSIGRVPPSRNRFWPSVEYRYSSHSRAAAGSGAYLLI